MKQHEYEARQRYKCDPVFHGVVKILSNWLIIFRLSPNELHDAVNLAGDLTSVQRNYQYEIPKEADHGR